MPNIQYFIFVFFNFENKILDLLDTFLPLSFLWSGGSFHKVAPCRP